MNISVKNRGFSGLALLAISVVFSACPARQQADQAKTAFQVEAMAYQEFSATANQRGEIPLQKLQLWASTLESLDGLVTRAQITPQMLQVSPGEVHELQVALKSVAERKFSHNLQVPQWHLEKAIDTKEKIHKTLLKLNEQYDRLFPGMRIAEMFDFDARMIVLVRDASLRDIRPDCVDLVGSYFQNALCLKRAEEICSHQADLTCVENVLDQNESAGCMVGAVTAGWMEKIAHCVSDQPISH